jgi:hypothetical protein
MTDNLLQRLADILTTLEDRELPLLSWGVTDTALTDDEVHSVLSHAVAEDLISGVADGPREDEYLSALTTHAGHATARAATPTIPTDRDRTSRLVASRATVSGGLPLTR